MSALRISILVAWVVFWIYWIISAASAKEGSRTTSFPDAYPGYKLKTKMLIPFVLQNTCTHTIGGTTETFLDEDRPGGRPGGCPGDKKRYAIAVVWRAYRRGGAAHRIVQCFKHGCRASRTL